MSEQDTKEILGTRKRNLTLTFNLKDQTEREIYEWCNEHTDKESNFIMQVLSQYKEYREFVQTVSKLHEMMPMMQQMFPTGAVSQNTFTNPLQQMSSQVNQQMNKQHPPNPNLQPFSNPSTKTQTQSSNSEPIPSRSARHNGSKRRRTSMPME